MQNSLGPNNYQNNDPSNYNNPNQFNNQNGYMNPNNYNPQNPNNGNKSPKLLIALVSVMSIVIIGLCILLLVLIKDYKKDDSSSNRSEAVEESDKSSKKDKDDEIEVDDDSDKDSDEDSSGSSKKSDELIKVGIINNDPNESGYRTANDSDLKSVFNAENGYDASFAYSLKVDEQIGFAQKFIEDGVDYLLISAADVAGWDDVLSDAQEVGVKVILFDRTIDADPSLYETNIISDMSLEGEDAASWLKDQNLSEYKIVHLQGVIGSAAQQGRSGGLETMAAEEGWTLVTQQTAEWNDEKAKNIVESVIDSGETFNVIYAENDDMARGAVEALDEAGISHGIGGDVIIMGFDCNTWALDELLAGNWNYDGQCSPFQASYIDEAIRKLEKGETLPPYTIIDEIGFDASTITQEDIDKYGL